MVPDMIRGRGGSPDSSKYSMYAYTPALAFRVSNIVSMKIICATIIN
jgi:hypothetical protein